MVRGWGSGDEGREGEGFQKSPFNPGYHIVCGTLLKASHTAQSIVEKLHISPPGKSPDSLVKLVLMGDFPRIKL